MEFDIGTILYIIITLVAVLIGVLGKKKKPADGGSGTPAGETRPSFMENLERVLTQGQEQPRIAELRNYEEDLPAEDYLAEEPEEQVQPMADPGMTLMQEYELIRKEGGISDPDLIMAEGGTESETLEVIDLDYETGTDYFEIVRDFDAGTAVVYSAIINRIDY